MLRTPAFTSSRAGRRHGAALRLAVPILLAAAPLRAADLPSRYYAPSPTEAPAPIFTWTGFYAGIHGELGLGSYRGGAGRLFGNSPIGGLGGVTAGYNYQSGQLLIGGEADAGFGSIGSDGNFGTGASGSGRINGLGTLRARVGYVYDRALFYATGGYAGTALSGRVSDFAGAPNLVLNQSHYLSGFSVGLGLEYAVTTRISIKGEYLFNGFNSANTFGGSRDATAGGANISLLRAGVNYHF